MTDNPPEVLNWKQACALLGCGKTYFYSLVNSGKIPAVSPRKVNGVRVMKADCLAFLAEREKDL